MIPSILGDRSNLRVYSNLGDTRRFHSNLSDGRCECLGDNKYCPSIHNLLFVVVGNIRIIGGHIQVAIHYLGFFTINAWQFRDCKEGFHQARNSINELGHVHVIFRFYRRRRLSQSFRRLSGI